MRSCPVEDEPAIYAWLSRTMDNIVIDRLRLLAREPLVADDLAALERGTEHGPTPERALLRGECERELVGLFGDLAGELGSRQRAVLGLYVRGFKRPQVARELGVRERVVKRDLEQILGRARGLLVERCGGGCDEGSGLVWRFAFGLAGQRETAEAQLHLVSCAVCQAFLDRLGSWREAAAAAVPVPAAGEAGPGLIERGSHALADLAGAVRERVGSPGSTVRQQVADGATQLKAQSASLYSRAVDPTPLAGMRPGATAAAIGACLALGAGATYCVDRGVAPLPGVADLLDRHDQRLPDRERHGARMRAAQVDPTPPATPQAPTVTAPTPEPAPTADQPVVQTTPVAPAPPPEQEQFDPAAAAAATTGSTNQPSVSTDTKPTATRDSGVGEFLGGP